jgi:formylglycine-generating enzyme required for sulfatase activity
METFRPVMVRRRQVSLVLGLAGGVIAGLPTAAVAQPDPSGIDFVTIGAVGNAPIVQPNPDEPTHGRGSVGYEYRIGRTEVTTAQWVEFFNAAFDRPPSEWITTITPPSRWGAVATTPTVPGGRRWVVPAGNEDLPVGGISWRAAAAFSNFLHNDRRTDLASLMSGAYDVTTFGGDGSVFTDQASRSPGARYWIPTWDEWLKAAHYDPARINPDGSTGGWWRFGNGSDDQFGYAPPGVGTANAGWDSNTPPHIDPFTVPLGAYAGVAQSPWGLLDVAGATTEWTESIRRINDGRMTRYIDGSYWTEPGDLALFFDDLRNGTSSYPSSNGFHLGFRVAAAIPSPSSVGLFSAAVALALCTRYRRSTCPSSSRKHAAGC